MVDPTPTEQDNNSTPDAEAEAEELKALREELRELDEETAEALDSIEPVGPSSAVGKFRRNTGAGLVLNGVAMGLAEIYDPVVKEDPPIVREDDGAPPFPRDIDAELDPEDPAGSTVTFRANQESS